MLPRQHSVHVHKHLRMEFHYVVNFRVPNRATVLGPPISSLIDIGIVQYFTSGNVLVNSVPSDRWVNALKEVVVELRTGIDL